MNAVAAVVINRNTSELLRECIETIFASEFAGGISVWVVDNGSDDGAPQMVLREFPGVDLIWNSSNAGYARACNQGINATREPYVLILNSDTALSANAVTEVIGYLERNPKAAIAAPMLRNSDGSLQYSCREFPSIKTAFVHGFLGLIRDENTCSARYKKINWDHERESNVDWVSGAFMAIRREALEEIGGFDEKYFMYVEDVDLCWRMWRAGWSVGYVPSAEVFHHIGMSSGATPARMVFHHHRGMLRFHRKSYDGPMRRTVNVAVGCGIAVRLTLIMALNACYRIRGVAKVIMPGRQ
ncbi:MAG: hypothetical protein CVT63_04680 [Candidatus Anoxymicrobium japonicum]|uniref:Uncharacterized protein n=1 Tax=Candidatus Anoxymicrobium japonicum TaxID=2013648 RepID=A0A2N3G615_9ACTN|nr:MAG: hypothetical protein CVT63_04680 [Candidatus Anoxymicrobium japonicum]